MKLYEINAGLRALLDGALDRIIDMETGEIFTAENLENLEMARDEKIEGCAVVYKENKADIEALAVEIKTLTERKRALERNNDWLKAYIQDTLEGAKFQTAKCSISYRKSSAVNVGDASLLPEEYQKVTIAANKVKIGEALKAGIAVPGAALEATVSMQIK